MQGKGKKYKIVNLSTGVRGKQNGLWVTFFGYEKQKEVPKQFFSDQHNEAIINILNAVGEGGEVMARWEKKQWKGQDYFNIVEVEPVDGPLPQQPAAQAQSQAGPKQDTTTSDLVPNHEIYSRIDCIKSTLEFLSLAKDLQSMGFKIFPTTKTSIDTLTMELFAISEKMRKFVTGEYKIMVESSVVDLKNPKELQQPELPESKEQPDVPAEPPADGDDDDIPY